jgi:NADH-quinone oxidoreductase subunit N
LSSLVQTVDWVAIGPPVAVALTAALVLLADVLVGARARAALGWLSLGGLAVAGMLLLPLLGERRGTFCVPGGEGVFPACSYEIDALSLSFQGLTVLGAAVVVLLSTETVAGDRLPAGEYWFLLLCSVTGALVLAASRDLLTLVVALEVVTLPTYALVGLRRDDPRSSEAALKLFLVSVVSAAVMLYGVALVYGVTGQVFLGRVATALADPRGLPAAAAVGVVLTIAGFAFKVAAVPFHFWAPDTYVGAPVPVAAYLSVISKASGFVGLVLVLAVGFPSYADRWAPVLAVLAAVTMSVGNLVALRQRHAVRLLAWSSIGQSGYMLLPLGTARADDPTGLARAVSATVTYVLAYAVMNLLAFAVVALVGRHRPDQRLADYRGLWRTEPLTAAALAFALACLAGLPPGLLGLFAKVVVFQAPVAAGSAWLAMVMAVNVVIGLAYYLAWAAALVGRPRPGDMPPSYRISVPDGIAVGAALGAAVAFSVAPGVLVDALRRGAPFLG